jgi:hypothetical protein
MTDSPVAKVASRRRDGLRDVPPDLEACLDLGNIQLSLQGKSY